VAADSSQGRGAGSRLRRCRTDGRDCAQYGAHHVGAPTVHCYQDYDSESSDNRTCGNVGGGGGDDDDD